MKSLSDLAKEGVYRTAFTNIAFGDIPQAALIACLKEAPPFLERTAVPFVVAVIDGITEKEDPGELWDVSDDSGKIDFQHRPRAVSRRHDPSEPGRDRRSG